MIAVQRDTVLCEPTNLAATDKQYIININVGPSWNSIIRFGVIELLRKNAWCFCMRYNNCNDFLNVVLYAVFYRVLHSCCLFDKFLTNC
jgi:hypothetical protein